MNARELRFEIFQGEAIPVIANLAYADGTLVLSGNVASANYDIIDQSTDTTVLSGSRPSVTGSIEASQQTLTLPDTGTGARSLKYTFSHELTDPDFLATTAQSLLVEFNFVRSSTSENVQLKCYVTLKPKLFTLTSIAGSFLV